jgi:hypothetical protein
MSSGWTRFQRNKYLHKKVKKKAEKDLTFKNILLVN